MKNKKNDKSKFFPIDSYEKELMSITEDFDTNVATATNKDTLVKMLNEAATNNIKISSTKPITIRVNQIDLVKIKAMAKRQGIPYQTLINSILHKSVN